MNNEEYNEDSELNSYEPELDHNGLESTEAETIKKVTGMYEE